MASIKKKKKEMKEKSTLKNVQKKQIGWDKTVQSENVLYHFAFIQIKMGLKTHAWK